MNTTANFAFKGTKDGLILFLNPDCELNELIAELRQHLQKSSHFLQGAAVRCFGGERKYTADEADELRRVLSEYQMELQGFLTEEEVQQRLPKTSQPPSPSPMRDGDDGMEEGNCLLVKRTIRSGQSVKFDGHVIVLGDVNPGAEIIATGNIFVMGILRGVAHAGASGDRNAVITANQLQPTQIRIGDMVTRPPADEGEAKGLEIARIKEDQLIVESMAANSPSFKGL